MSGGAARTGVGRGGAAAQRICGRTAGRPSSRGRRGKECPVQAHSPTHRREAPVGRRPRRPRDQAAAASDGSPRDGRRGPGELGVGQHGSVRDPRGWGSCQTDARTNPSASLAPIGLPTPSGAPPLWPLAAAADAARRVRLVVVLHEFAPLAVRGCTRCVSSGMQLSMRFTCGLGCAPPATEAVPGGPPRPQRTQLPHATTQIGWQPGLKGNTVIRRSSSWLLSDAALCVCVMACEAACSCMAEGHGLRRVATGMGHCSASQPAGKPAMCA